MRASLLVSHWQLDPTVLVPLTAVAALYLLAAAVAQLRGAAPADPLLRAAARPARGGDGPRAAPGGGDRGEMRGGAIPILAWGTILLVLAIGNWVWNAKPVSGAAASAAVAIIYLLGVLLWVSRREALRRGPPEPRPDLDSVPQASLAAAGIGVSLGCILFGIAWARFLVAFGIGLLVLSLGRLVLEMRAERYSRINALGREARK